jgi:hypothetical protein
LDVTSQRFRELDILGANFDAHGFSPRFHCARRSASTVTKKSEIAGSIVLNPTVAAARALLDQARKVHPGAHETVGVLFDFAKKFSLSLQAARNRSRTVCDVFCEYWHFAAPHGVLQAAAPSPSPRAVGARGLSFLLIAKGDDLKK